MAKVSLTSEDSAWVSHPLLRPSSQPYPKLTVINRLPNLAFNKPDCLNVPGGVPPTCNFSSITTLFNACVNPPSSSRLAQHLGTVSKEEPGRRRRGVESIKAPESTTEFARGIVDGVPCNNKTERLNYTEECQQYEVKFVEKLRLVVWRRHSRGICELKMALAWPYTEDINDLLRPSFVPLYLTTTTRRESCKKENPRCHSEPFPSDLIICLDDEATPSDMPTSPRPQARSFFNLVPQSSKATPTAAAVALRGRRRLGRLSRAPLSGLDPEIFAWDVLRRPRHKLPPPGGPAAASSFSLPLAFAECAMCYGLRPPTV
ncbi:unnamed protein product [Nesidiocoris tenuis]|uniref:Uncharacterized protein n=1 Tax=Nesidiocoris tenuis TaxID=355587 RepID=A0A6H5G557_9HEMI|nr:unnamed protein product [Nesidiocoris tenuis]